MGGTGAEIAMDEDGQLGLEQKPCLTRTLVKTKSMVFGGAYSVSRGESSRNTIATVLSTTIVGLQVLALTFKQTIGFPWDSSASGWFSDILGFISLTNYETYHDDVYSLFLYISLSWSAVLLLLIGWIGFSESKGTYVIKWPLRVASFMLSLTSTIFAIPLLSILTSVITCGLADSSTDTWRVAGGSCWTGFHMAISVFAILFTLVVGITVLLLQLFWVDRRLHSSNFGAKVHGRVDLVHSLTALVLIIMIDIMGPVVNVWVSIGAVVLGSIVTTAAVFLYLPYYKLSMNKLKLSLCLLNCWAAVCLVSGALIDSPNNNSSITFFLGAPFALAVGSVLTDFRAKRVVKLPQSRLSTPYSLELRTRILIRQALQAKEGERWNDEESATPLTSKDGKPEDDAESTHMELPGMVTEEVENCFAWGFRMFAQSPTMSAFSSMYHKCVSGNTHLELCQLALAERLKPSLDWQFYVYERRREIEETNFALGGIRRAAILRVEFERHQQSARRSAIKVANQQSSFWQELNERVPKLLRLRNLALNIRTGTIEADQHYQALLQINHQSVSALRSYANFLENVVNDDERASQYAIEAQRIEDQQLRDNREEASKVKLMESTNLDVMSDNVAVISIGGMMDNLGIITSCNPYACRLFGYSSVELLKRNVNMLLPNPIDTFHDMFLRKYMKSGTGRVLNATRVVFGKHKLGYIFPMVLCVRGTPPTEGPPSFVGFLRGVVTPFNYIIVDGDNLTVTSGTQASLTMLEVTGQGLESGEMKITDWVSDFTDHVEDLQSKKGTKLMFVHDDGRHERREFLQCWLQVIHIPRMPPLYVISWRRTVESEHATHQVTDDEEKAVPEKNHTINMFTDDQPADEAQDNAYGNSIPSDEAVESEDGEQGGGGGSDYDDNDHKRLIELLMDDSGAGQDAGMAIVPDSKAVAEGESDPMLNAATPYSGPVDAEGVELASAMKKPSAAVRSNDTPKSRRNSAVSFHPSDRGGKSSPRARSSVGGGSSIASSRRNMKRLRRALLSTDQPMAEGLRPLMCSGWLISVLGSVLTIVLAVGASLLFKTYINSLEHLTSAGDRNHLSVAIAYNVKLLNLMSTWLDDTDESLIRERIVSLSNDFNARQMTAYEYEMDRGNADAMVVPSIDVLVFEDGSPPTKVISRLEAGYSLTANAYVVAQTDLADLQSNSLVKNVVENGGGGPISVAFLDTLEGAVKGTKDDADQVEDITLYVYIALMGVMTIYVLAAMVPILFRVETSRFRVVKAFLAVPPNVSARLKNSAEKRVKRIARTEGDEEMDWEEDSEQSGADDDEEDTDWVELTAAGLAKAQNSRRLRRQRSSRAAAPTYLKPAQKSPLSFVALLTKFLIPLLTVAVYFTVFYFTSSTQLADGSAEADHIRLAETRRSLTSKVLLFAYEHVTMLDEDPLKSEAAYNLTMETADELEAVHRTLLGSSARSSIRNDQDIAIEKLTTGNACSMLFTGTELATCTNFRSGLLTRGLHAGLEEYLRAIRTVSYARHAAFVNDSSGIGTTTVNGVAATYSIPDVINSADFEFLRVMDEFYLWKGFYQPVELFFDKGREILLSFLDVNEIMAVVFIIFLLFFQLFFYQPFVKRVDRHIKFTNTVLLMLPEPVIRQIPLFRELILRLNSDDALMMAGIHRSDLSGTSVKK